MNFTIANEEFTFTIEVDGEGNLTEFTATRDETTFDCKIQLTSRDAEPVIECCGANGCMAGSCGG
jgi:hypothetical protein